MKNLLLSVVVLFFLIGANAQDNHVEPGIKVGLNLAQIKEENSDYSDMLAGFHLGGLVHIHLTRHLAIQPELVFSSQGSKQTFSNIIYTTRLNYINIPVLFQYMLGTGFRFQTGPQLGVLLSAKDKHGSITDNIISNCKRYDFAWVLGMSYIMKSGLGFDTRYNVGLTSIYTSAYPKHFNRVFQFGVLYQFGKKAHALKE